MFPSVQSAGELLRIAFYAALFLARPSFACGDLVSLETHGGSTTLYALGYPPNASANPIVLLLLVGGGGHIDLDDKACPRALLGNTLIRSLPLFKTQGFITALVDAPSDYPGEDGLAGFRMAAQHAEDIGKVIADVRKRTKSSAVWVVATSRGTLSGVNAATRLVGPAAPDGLVLSSALTSGAPTGKKAWVKDNVFDLPLENIRIPLLLIGHADDRCPRTPTGLMNEIAARTRSPREQTVIVTNSPQPFASVDACEGRTPHGFIGQEGEVAAGIARFVRGGTY